MKRNRTSRRPRPTQDSELLVRLATQLSQSSCRIEDAFWEERLTAAVSRLLAERDEETLIATMDQLYNAGSRAYEELADVVEACAESVRSPAAGNMDVLTIAIPVLAWSRFQIPSGPIAATQLASLRTHLQAHVLAGNAKLALCDFLFSPDQLPQSFSETAQLTERLAKAALHNRDLPIDPHQLPETVGFLSDTRYLLGAVAAPRGTAIFRWQEDDGDRQTALREWGRQGGEVLRSLLPACAVEFQPPQAFHAAIRDADRASRPYSLRAAVAFLVTTLNRAAGEFRAVVAPFHDNRLEEYRIGFTLADSLDVVHGVVWPMLDNEDEATDTPSQIESVLRESGLTRIQMLEQRFPLEYCDDCGAPLYPNPDGEPVHAELPEDQAEATPRHLH